MNCIQKYWNLPAKATQIGAFFSTAERLWSLPTEATQVDCILFTGCSAQRTFLESNSH
jgi:hypothetical protein